ncbi:class I SAM-dependent methyltransferase [Kitasatospora atroaurantiaca]|uniref:Methyltransferase family protein n=1 Tax=Kitasatospora atroaurantiaca TaxID=285545 RepID=A0A561F0J2_9ACTN|nr:class I SAM-dependent methyltransferase [Kitasatospora atroaurantiaca]TWE21383.1 methyltransferase family protein [Kitasatospora atroaurantiaca]
MWQRYLAEFHQRRPGITEAVLSRAYCQGGTGYEWLFEEVPPAGRLLDLACGSAPLWPALGQQCYLGLDISPGELALARSRGAGPLLLADARALPLGAESVDTVVCAMALQIITPLPTALAEIRRVLVPGGRLVALVPDRRPLHLIDPLWLGGLLGALGRPIGYPNDRALRRRLPQLLDAAGLCLADDRRRRFAYRLGTREDADLLLSSLYLPGVSAARLRAAQRWLNALVRVRADLPVPLRRIVAVRL